MAIEINPKLVKGSENGFYEEKDEEEQEKRPDFISGNSTRPHSVWGSVFRLANLEKYATIDFVHDYTRVCKFVLYGWPLDIEWFLTLFSAL